MNGQPEELTFSRYFKNIADGVISAMKGMKITFLILGIIMLNLSLTAQKVFKVDYESQADIKVYNVSYESQCDLKVYVEDYASQAKGNSGSWFFVKYKSQADKTVYFVDYESQADLKIYMVDYKSQAGWRNKSKQHLLY
jgi:cytochrome oxidase Cu insertion factor (SCO1/SenC/PrrC family)